MRRSAPGSANLSLPVGAARYTIHLSLAQANLGESSWSVLLMFSRGRAALLLLACTLAVLSPLFLYSAATRLPPAQNGPPRLIVLVYFDQMRGDYLARWQGLYGRGGFRRLCTEGAWFTNCH